MTIEEFYNKHKGRTYLKIAQMNALEEWRKRHTLVEWQNMTTELKHLHFITTDEYIDLDGLEV